MSRTVDTPSAPPSPGQVEGVREQFALLARLLAVADPQPWMGLDLTMPQFKVLLYLWHNGRTRVGLLAERLGVHVSSVSGIIDRLVEAGFVCREDAAEDRRLVLSRLSAKGEETLTCLYQGRAARLAARLGALSAEELRALDVGMGALLAEW